MNLKPIQSANSNQLLSLVRFPLFFPWHSSITLLFSPPPPAIKGCIKSLMCVRGREHTEDPFLPLHFISRTLVAFFSPFALTSLCCLALGCTRYSHFFSWVLLKRKTGYTFLPFEICKDRVIIPKKRKDQEYYSEKTGELYSGIPHLEMKVTKAPHQLRWIFMLLFAVLTSESAK